MIFLSLLPKNIFVEIYRIALQRVCRNPVCILHPMFFPPKACEIPLGNRFLANSLRVLCPQRTCLFFHPEFSRHHKRRNPQKLGVVKKMMVNMVKKSLEKKADKTEDDLHTLETFKGADNTRKEAIEDLVAFCM